MKTKHKKLFCLKKTLTGIEGFDDMTGGGLPANRTTLIAGGPGCGKTVFAIQALVNGARHFGEPGMFVAFEENARQIVANAATFGWDLLELEQQKLFFLDARIKPDQVKPGQFTLAGMLAGIQVIAQQIGAKRIVFDSIDILLTLLDDPVAERQELFRLHDWLRESGLTGIITTKIDEDITTGQRYGFIKFMVDCVVTLNHRMVNQVSMRALRVVKYRGSAFAENEAPLVIGSGGLEVISLRGAEPVPPVSMERVSTGVRRLDDMLGGGYYRGSSVLITGTAGTAKSTLSGAFAQAACLRRERALYVAFEESAPEILRNFSSVGIRLAPHVKSGLLKIITARAEGSSADVHFLKLRNIIRQFRPRCVVVDPLSTMGAAGGETAAKTFAERLIQLIKCEGITLVCTSLVQNADPRFEATPLQISSASDTWIHLTYPIQSGERNRALTIVKSRGMEHSNQVLELVLSQNGITLNDVYASGGDVLLGTMRWQKESAEQAEQEQIHAEVELKRREIELAREELNARVTALHRELNMKQTELDYLLKAESIRKGKLGVARARPPRPRDSSAANGRPHKLAARNGQSKGR